MVAVEVVNAEFPVGGVVAEQVVGDFENIAADRQHCSSMPYVSAQVTITCAKGGALGAACGTAGFHQRGAYPAIASAGLAAAALTRALMIAGTHAGPAREMRGAGEAAHVGANFGHHHFGGGAAERPGW